MKRIILDIKEPDFLRFKQVAEYYLSRIKKKRVFLSDSEVIRFVLGTFIETLEPKMSKEKSERWCKRAKERMRKWVWMRKRAKERSRKKAEKD